MKLGYIRVSTKEQNYDIQLKALLEAGVLEENIYKEKESGKSVASRIELKKLLDFIRKGDEFIVYDLSRLGRNTKDVLLLLEELNLKGITFISLKENLDYSKPTGKFFVSVLSALNQLDLEVRNEKTKEGLERAKAKGIKLGRPTLDPNIVSQALKLYDSGVKTSSIIKFTGISNGSLYRAIKEREKTGK